MPMTDTQRREHLAALGLAPDGPTLVVTPPVDAVPEAPAAPAPVATPVQTPGLPALPPDELLLADGAFDRHKLSARDHGRAVSSPFNKLLHARICTLTARVQREAHAATKTATTGHVRNRARDAATDRTAQVAIETVLALLAEHGMSVSDLARLSTPAPITQETT